MFTNKSYIPIKPHLQIVISIVELLYYQKAIMENSSLYYSRQQNRSDVWEFWIVH